MQACFSQYAATMKEAYDTLCGLMLEDGEDDCIPLDRLAMFLQNHWPGVLEVWPHMQSGLAQVQQLPGPVPLWAKEVLKLSADFSDRTALLSFRLVEMGCHIFDEVTQAVHIQSARGKSQAMTAGVAEAAEEPIIDVEGGEVTGNGTEGAAGCEEIACEEAAGEEDGEEHGEEGGEEGGEEQGEEGGEDEEGVADGGEDGGEECCEEGETRIEGNAEAARGNGAAKDCGAGDAGGPDVSAAVDLAMTARRIDGLKDTCTNLESLSGPLKRVAGWCKEVCVAED